MKGASAVSTIKTSILAGECPLAGVMGHAGWISPSRALATPQPSPIRPDGELISRGKRGRYRKRPGGSCFPDP